MIELDEVLIKQLEYAFYNRLEGPTLRRLREILNLSPVCTWADVRDAAEHFKVSTEEILKFIESKKRKI